jgi:tRNA-Thr(GGU) m(6)t(6)A37 methyltransferase TsaA
MPFSFIVKVVTNLFHCIKEIKMTTEYSLTSIGLVRASVDGFCLELDQKYVPALTGLDGFSYINVFWWAHLGDKEEYRALLTCDTPYKNAPETMGIFATRSPFRPNPIALTAVPVLHIDHENGKIVIPYIDAEDGTPILDIKPYHPCTDRIRDVSVPAWCQDWPLWYEDSASFNWEAVFENAS